MPEENVDPFNDPLVQGLFAGKEPAKKKEPKKPTRGPDEDQFLVIGPGPDAKSGPECHLCHDTRRLVPDVLKLPDGRKGHLCRTCIKQVEWDRARRCICCGAPTEKKLMNSGGVCPTCEKNGAEATHNLIELIKLRWVGVIRG